MSKQSIQHLAKSKLCISCGLCAGKDSAVLKYRRGMFVPVFKKRLSWEESRSLYEICPGKGYPMVAMGKELYDRDGASYDYRLGCFRTIGAATSLDGQLLANSTSGAMISAIACHLLENGLVDGVLTVKFSYENGLRPTPFIATTKEELIQSQGSKYMPVPLLEIMDQVGKFSESGTLAVIGTPCQIAGLRLLQQQDERIKRKVRYTIANFCGGFRDFRETERIVELCGLRLDQLSCLRFRGNGQPGTMRLEQADGKQAELKYPDYSRLTGYIKYYRCRTCIDAMGELADISCGDAWLPRFLESDRKWSFYVCRSAEIERIVARMTANGDVCQETITNEELYASQRGNLTTKKERQSSRFQLMRMLCKPVPDFGNGGYSTRKTGLMQEAKVYVIHNIMYLLERLRLYHAVFRFLKHI